MTSCLSQILTWILNFSVILSILPHELFCHQRYAWACEKVRAQPSDNNEGSTFRKRYFHPAYLSETLGFSLSISVALFLSKTLEKRLFFSTNFLNPCLSDYMYIRGEVDDGFSLYPYSSLVYHQYNVFTLSIQKKINRNKEKRAQEYAWWFQAGARWSDQHHLQ